MAENKRNMKGRVTVYSVPGCPHCIQAKATLRKLGLPVCDMDINKHGDVAFPDAEPLIHFALNCNAKGCPPIKTYTPQNDDSCVIDSVRRTQPVFKWYKTDFQGTDKKLLNWVFNHMGLLQRKWSLKALLSAGNVKASYLPYDWSINSPD